MGCASGAACFLELGGHAKGELLGYIVSILTIFLGTVLCVMVPRATLPDPGDSSAVEESAHLLNRTLDRSITINENEDQKTTTFRRMDW